MPPPQYDPKTCRFIVKLSPVAFVLAYLLAAVQGAPEWPCLVIATVACLGCLAAAGLYRLRGPQMRGDAYWLQLILRLFVK